MVNNKVQFFCKKSFKITDRNKIAHYRPRFLQAGTLRPEISARPGRAVQSDPARRFTTLSTTTYYVDT